MAHRDRPSEARVAWWRSLTFASSSRGRCSHQGRSLSLREPSETTCEFRQVGGHLSRLGVVERPSPALLEHRTRLAHRPRPRERREVLSEVIAATLDHRAPARGPVVPVGTLEVALP
jgi:hypothetical protein